MNKSQFKNNNKEAGLINLGEWKKKLNELSENKNWEKYLSLLGFGSLIGESNEVKDNLNNSDLDSDLTMKSKILLEEIRNRLSDEAPHLEEELNEFQKKTEKKLGSLKNDL